MKGIRYALLSIFLLVGCRGHEPAQKSPTMINRGTYNVDIRHLSPVNRPRIKILVIHYTADDFDRSLAMLTGPDVSAHYLISQFSSFSDANPTVWQLVPESDLAWHAGVSFWRGRTRINDVSIGIELVNFGYRWQKSVQWFYSFNRAQITALVPLAKDIIARYNILPQNVVAHGDIAPQRKIDPGPLFPWQQLAAQGIGAWPDDERVAFYLHGRDPYQPVSNALVLDLLAQYGYEVPPGISTEKARNVIRAFQMHFRPGQHSGIADAQTQAIAEALLEKYGQG